MRIASLALATSLLAACSSPAAPTASSATAEPSSPPPSAAIVVASAPPPAPVVAPPPSMSATAAPLASAPPAASSAAAPEGAGPPASKVSNIGMHIGGGPNDDGTKEPIRSSIQPHFPELAACYGLVEERKAGDASTDLRIGRDGGKAKVLKGPTTALKGAKFRECLIGVFEGIDFKKPKTGDTIVSYGLRFTP